MTFFQEIWVTLLPQRQGGQRSVLGSGGPSIQPRHRLEACATLLPSHCSTGFQPVVSDMRFEKIIKKALAFSFNTTYTIVYSGDLIFGRPQLTRILDWC